VEIIYGLEKRRVAACVKLFARPHQIRNPARKSPANAAPGDGGASFDRTPVREYLTDAQRTGGRSNLLLPRFYVRHAWRTLGDERPPVEILVKTAASLTTFRRSPFQKPRCTFLETRLL